MAHFILLFVFIRNQFGILRLRRAFTANLFLINNRLWAGYKQINKITTRSNILRAPQRLLVPAYHVSSGLLSSPARRAFERQLRNIWHDLGGRGVLATWGLSKWRKKVEGESAMFKHRVCHREPLYQQNVIFMRFAFVFFLLQSEKRREEGSTEGGCSSGRRTQ